MLPSTSSKSALLSPARVYRRGAMWNRRVQSIHIASAAKQPTHAVEQVQAVPGRGLEGDRYYCQQGTFFKPQPGRRGANPERGSQNPA